MLDPIGKGWLAAIEFGADMMRRQRFDCPVGHSDLSEHLLVSFGRSA